jgi:GLPGLI family protein
MNQITIIFILSISFFCYGQNRFVYEYRFVPDVNRKDSIVTDYMQLDTDKNGSDFYCVAKQVNDSLINAVETSNLRITKLPKYNPNLNYSVSKNYKTEEVLYHLKYAGVYMKIPETEKPNWKIINEIKNIGNYNCRKAEVNYLGRSWTAWFTGDIPISDGPYKFNGLPGLVLEICDSENQHCFELIQIKKIPEIKILKKYKNEKEITWEKLNKLKSENNEAGISKMFVSANGASFILNDDNVVHVDMSNKDIEGELSKQIRIMNNPIELDKAVIYK